MAATHQGRLWCTCRKWCSPDNTAAMLQAAPSSAYRCHSPEEMWPGHPTHALLQPLNSNPCFMCIWVAGLSPHDIAGITSTRNCQAAHHSSQACGISKAALMQACRHIRLAIQRGSLAPSAVAAGMATQAHSRPSSPCLMVLTTKHTDCYMHAAHMIQTMNVVIDDGAQHCCW